MTKEDVVELVIKAAGVFFVVQMVLIFPRALGSLVFSLWHFPDLVSSAGENAMAGDALQKLNFATGASAMFKMLLYFFAAKNLLNSGSLVRFLITKTKKS